MNSDQHEQQCRADEADAAGAAAGRPLPRWPRSQRDFQPVVGRADAQRRRAAGDLLQAPRLGEHGVDGRVVEHRLVVEQAQVARAGQLAQLDADDVAANGPSRP